MLKIAKEEERLSNHKKLNKRLPVTILQHKLYNHLVFNDSNSIPLERTGDHHPHFENIICELPGKVSKSHLKSSYRSH